MKILSWGDVGEWRVISDSENLAINGCGRICKFSFDESGRPVPRFMRKKTKLKDGYLTIRLNIQSPGETEKEDRFIHHLVAQEFLGPPPWPDFEVWHKDGNFTNNHVDNLEYVTVRDYFIRRARFFFREDEIRKINDLFKAGRSKEYLARKFGRSLARVTEVVEYTANLYAEECYS